MMGGYLAAWIALVSLTLGALTLLAVAETTSASFFVPMRRAVEAMAGLLPFCVLTFVPIAIFSRALYPQRFAAVRSLLLLLSWTAIEEVHRRWSLAEDSASGAELDALRNRRRALLAVSLPFILFTGTLAAFDWLMALEPGWVSHAYGAIFLIAGAAAANAVTVAYAARSPQVRPAQLHAISNLLLASVMLFAYLAFSQLLIQWIADIPHEITWYLRRTRGIWTYVAAAMGVASFALPFLLLLVRALKRTRAMLVVAALVLFGHLLDCALLVLPATGVSLLGVLSLLLFPIAYFIARVRYRGARTIPNNDRLHAAALRFEMPS